VALSPLAEGVSALLAGDPLRAVRALREVLEDQPFHPVAHFDLAVAYRLRGELPHALGHARLAMELGGSARAHTLYGIHLQLAHQPELARLQMAQALQLEPDYRLGAVALGLLAREQGQLEEAVRWLELSLQPAPSPLPVLVAERVRGQLFDLQRAPADQTPKGETWWCSVSAVTEILRVDGTPRVLEPRLDPVSVRPVPAREITAEALARRVLQARRIVALTGAGISSASGLSTRKQLWKRFDRDAAVSAIGVRRDPGVLWRVVRDFLGEEGHPPNAAHQVLARLPGLVAIVTQNVDELHWQAALPGSQVPVLELHGTLSRMRCTDCGALDAHPASAYLAQPAPPRCASCQSPLRPDVVLFGEQLPARALEVALDEVLRCDLLLVVGCAMDVAPASELPRLAAGRGAQVVELKRTPSRISDAVGSELLLGPAEETLPEVYRQLGLLGGDLPESLPAMPPARPPQAPPPPLLTPVLVPYMGEAQDEVTLARWLRVPGEMVKQGEPIVEFEADKVNVEIEAPVSGVLRTARAELWSRLRIHEIFAEIEPIAVPPSRVPVREPAHPLFVQLGPHAAAVRRAIEGLHEARWLLPEDGPALRAAIPELLRQHARALHPEAPLPLVPWYTEDPAEVLARWRRDWLLPGTDTLRELDPDTLRWIEATSGRSPRRPPLLRDYVSARVDRRIKELHGAKLPWGYARAHTSIAALTHRWLDGLIERGQDSDPPCPAAPLLEIYRRGAWPFALAGGIVGIFLPQRETLARCDVLSSSLPMGRLLSLVGLHRLPMG
jgi:NAD-dependent deacetylase